MLEDIKRITEEVFGIKNIAKRKREEDYPRGQGRYFYTIVEKFGPEPITSQK